MRVVRLPSWPEIVAHGGPWALVLRSGGAGIWLLRGAAEEEGVDARIVAGVACATSSDALSEWSGALELGEKAAGWGELTDLVAADRWMHGEACGVLVGEAERLLEREPSRLPELLESVRSAAARLAGEGRTLRVVFQSRFESAPERLAVFREFDVADVA